MSPPWERRVFRATLVGSMLAHGVVFAGMSRGVGEPDEKRPHRPLEVVVHRPAPPPPAPPPQETVPPRPSPRRAPARAPAKMVKPPPSLPPPNQEAAPATPEPQRATRPVFGVTMSSVVAPGSGSFGVQVGNTLMMKPAAPAPSSAPAEPYRGALVSVAAVDQAPRRLGECEAEYPPLARSQGIEGRVRLRLRIEADGRVGKVELLSGVGSGLDEAAMHAMRRCRFSPAKVAKEPVTTEITYTYAFVIEG